MDILTIWRKISVIYLGVSEFIRSTFRGIYFPKYYGRGGGGKGWRGKKNEIEELGKKNKKGKEKGRKKRGKRP